MIPEDDERELIELEHEAGGNLVLFKEDVIAKMESIRKVGIDGPKESSSSIRYSAHEDDEESSSEPFYDDEEESEGEAKKDSNMSD